MDISVIVTNYNYSKLIRRCIRSLLNQNIDHKNYEIIVVDDCSTDNSVEVIESFTGYSNIKLIKSSGTKEFAIEVKYKRGNTTNLVSNAFTLN